MQKKSISTKQLLMLILGAFLLALATSCSIEEYELITDLDSECETGSVDYLVGSYAWELNKELIITIDRNSTISYRQNGILNSVSIFCVVKNTSYLKVTNEYDQISYLNFSVVDSNGTNGIVLDGQFYESL